MEHSVVSIVAVAVGGGGRVSTPCRPIALLLFPPDWWGTPVVKAKEKSNVGVLQPCISCRWSVREVTCRTKTLAKNRRTSDCITIADSTRTLAFSGCSRATIDLICLQVGRAPVKYEEQGRISPKNAACNNLPTKCPLFAWTVLRSSSSFAHRRPCKPIIILHEPHKTCSTGSPFREWRPADDGFCAAG